MKNCFTGGKGGSGTYQQIINLIPPHETYIELFLGSGAIMRNKKPAGWNIGVDLDLSPSSDLKWKLWPARLDLRRQDAFDFLGSPTVRQIDDRPVFIYVDPPYLGSCRRRNYYQHELNTDVQHESLLELLKSTVAMVMISGYPSKLYDDVLDGWHTHTYNSMTRGGVRTEKLWMNYPKPTLLHDYSYAGDDYRDRERIKKKRARWIKRLRSLPDLERGAILSDIKDNFL